MNHITNVPPFNGILSAAPTFPAPHLAGGGNYTSQPSLNTSLQERFDRDIFDPQVQFVVVEAREEVDGKNVLAKVSGTFFVPDGISRNNRFYPKDLWDRVIKNADVQKRLRERRMFGTIGHEQAINDNALLEGKVSHIVTSITIDGAGKGLGEALILDTPAGRILNVFLRAGSKLYVSSRANGSFRGEYNGVPKVDPDTYLLNGFDFVIDPGFYQANPELVESLENLVHDFKKLNSDKGEHAMGAEVLLENLAKENGSLKVDLERAMKDLDVSKNEKKALDQENRTLKERLEKQEYLERRMEEYRAIGTPEKLNRALELMEKKLRQYSHLGAPEKIREALDKTLKLLEKYKKLGSPNEIDEAFNKCKKAVLAYKDLGTPAHIREAFQKTETLVKGLAESKASRRVSVLANELGVSEDKVKKVYGKMPEKEIKELFKDIKESSKITSTFRKSMTESKPVSETKGKEENPLRDKPRGLRIMESLSK